MEPITVSSQYEYDEAQRLYQDNLDKSYFDIDRGKGREIVEEADHLIYRYLTGNITKESAESNLSRHYFTETQAREITGYFLARRPKDLYDIERGLNALNLRIDKTLNVPAPRIHIKGAEEKISVYYPVEVFDESQVRAFGHGRVIAHDNARITAHDWTVVEALDNTRVKAFDQARITAKNSSQVSLYLRSGVKAYNYASVTAKDHTKAAIFDNANAEVSDNAMVDSYNDASVIARDTARIKAFHNTSVIAYDKTFVIAKDESYIFAWDSSIVHAEDNSAVVANGKAKVNAKHHALVFVIEGAVCEYADRVRVINRAQNKPCFLISNTLKLLDHPFVEGEPVIAVNILLAASDPQDKEGFNRQLKEMGCINSESTNRILNSLKNEAYRKRHGMKNPDQSWER
jgi:hypothetical protein